jgi:hypothetical protein
MRMHTQISTEYVNVYRYLRFTIHLNKLTRTNCLDSFSHLVSFRGFIPILLFHRLPACLCVHKHLIKKSDNNFSHEGKWACWLCVAYLDIIIIIFIFHAIGREN